MPTQRYRLTIAYRGTRYHGWQWQAANPLTWKGPKPPAGHGIPTIQETLARALGSVVGHPVNLVGSSRTDAGVHAKGQIAHFDTDQLQIPAEGLRRAVNARLPDDILIRQIDPVAPEFDAILSTQCKRYQYFIWNGPERPVFFADMAWHRWQPFDDRSMREAAAHVVGEHDFAAFTKAGHGRETTVRRVMECSVSRRGPRIVVGVTGTGFLWNMVRIIVGTLVEVGTGRLAPDAVTRMLQTGERRHGGNTAPAQGLFLHWIRMKNGEMLDLAEAPGSE